MYDADDADYDYDVYGEYDYYDNYDDADDYDDHYTWYISPTVGKYREVLVGLGSDACYPSSPCSCNTWAVAINNSDIEVATCQTTHRGKRATPETYGSATLDLGAPHTLSTVQVLQLLLDIYLFLRMLQLHHRTTRRQRMTILQILT